MPIVEGSGQPSSAGGETAIVSDAPSAPAQSSPQKPGGGGSKGSPTKFQPEQPSVFGRVRTGWTDSEDDTFFRQLPAAGFENTSTQAQTDNYSVLTWPTELYNDGVVLPESSGAQISIYPRYRGHDLGVEGFVQWASNSSGQRRIAVQITRVDGSTATRELASAPATSAAVGESFSFPMYVGDGTTAVDFFDVRAATSTAAGVTHPDVTYARLTIVQLR